MVSDMKYGLYARKSSEDSRKQIQSIDGQIKSLTKKAKTEHVMPARIPKRKYNEVLNIAKKTHIALNCRGVTRSDFKFFKNNFYLLEINTQPGMTNLSLVPEIADYSGLTFENLVEKILLDASTNR